jgi:hypothetical protein
MVSEYVPTGTSEWQRQRRGAGAWSNEGLAPKPIFGLSHKDGGVSTNSIFIIKQKKKKIIHHGTTSSLVWNWKAPPHPSYGIGKNSLLPFRVT